MGGICADFGVRRGIDIADDNGAFATAALIAAGNHGAARIYAVGIGGGDIERVVVIDFGVDEARIHRLAAGGIVDARIGEGNAEAAAVLVGELQIHGAAPDPDIGAVIGIQDQAAACPSRGAIDRGVI